MEICRNYFMIKKILLIDDSPVSRKIIKKCMPIDNVYEIFEASDGKSGFEQFTKINPDVVFLDLTMPVMDGREFLREVEGKTGKTIIIVCTADIQMKSLAEVMNLGAFMIVKKPPSKVTIQDALTKAEEKIRKL